MQVQKLKKRSQFVTLGNNCQRHALPAMIVLSANEPSQGKLKIGFTASKKVGNAVKRAKAKRRMRAVVDEVIRLNEAFNTSGLTLNFIARAYIMNRDFNKMVKELKNMLEQELKCSC